MIRLWLEWGAWETDSRYFSFEPNREGEYFCWDHAILNLDSSKFVQLSHVFLPKCSSIQFWLVHAEYGRITVVKVSKVQLAWPGPVYCLKTPRPSLKLTFFLEESTGYSLSRSRYIELRVILVYALITWLCESLMTPPQIAICCGKWRMSCGIKSYRKVSPSLFSHSLKYTYRVVILLVAQLAVTHNGAIHMGYSLESFGFS